MIYIREEFSDITFEYPACPRVVFADFARKFPKSVYCLMCSFCGSARKRVGNKSPIEKWIQDPINRMMQKPVADCRFMDIPWFRIAYPESLIASVVIGMIEKIIVERKDITHQLHREFLHVFPVFLSNFKFSPSQKQVF